jgi:hypothetical protein
MPEIDQETDLEVIEEARHLVDTAKPRWNIAAREKAAQLVYAAHCLTKSSVRECYNRLY